MRLKVIKSKNTNIFYVIKTIYVNGKQKTKTIERIGNEQEVIKKAKGKDPIIWAKEYINALNKEEKEEKNDIIIKKSQQKQIIKDIQNLYNCGYLFLQKIYYDLQLNKICDEISDRYQFKFDLNKILSNLIYSRVIFPSSKLATQELSNKFIEQPNLELQHIYRGVDEIIKVNHMRWEIEESFRIMKTEFKSRPVYLSNDDRIEAHFMTCYIALLIQRILEKKLNEKNTTQEIIKCLRNMNMVKIEGEGFIPAYTRDNLTDKLHDKFGFRTDFEITSIKNMRKILKISKKC